MKDLFLVSVIVLLVSGCVTSNTLTDKYGRPKTFEKITGVYDPDVKLYFQTEAPTLYSNILKGKIEFQDVVDPATIEEMREFVKSNNIKFKTVVEEITIKSANPFILPDLVDGIENYPPVEIIGKLVLPEGNGKYPVMVQIHGSGGLKPEKQINKYGALFISNGIGYFYLDHFSPRGVSRTVGNQSKVTGTSMTADAFMILEALSKHSKVDPKRIGIMGWSKGGGVAIYSAMEPYRKGVLTSKNKFALHVGIYPVCIFDWKTESTGAPMRFILAENENWAGIKGCLTTTKRYKSRGIDVGFSVIDDAFHSFDNWGEQDKHVRNNTSGFGHNKCDLEADLNGMIQDRHTGLLYNSKENRDKIYKNCTSRGVTTGFDMRAAYESLKLVTEFVVDTFNGIGEYHQTGRGNGKGLIIRITPLRKEERVK